MWFVAMQVLEIPAVSMVSSYSKTVVDINLFKSLSLSSHKSFAVASPRNDLFQILYHLSVIGFRFVDLK